MITKIIFQTGWESTPHPIEDTTRVIGNTLLTKYLLPFELISLVLLFVLIGAIMLVRKEFKS